jgi:hypothetical protein
MSEERAHTEVEYEPRDLSALGILGFLAGLAIVGFVLQIILVGVYSYLDQYTKKHEPPVNPLVTITNPDTRNPTPQTTQEFPQPRLETNEVGQLRDRRVLEESILDSYGWVDQKAGTAHIPIDRAMDLIAQRGLPTVPPAISSQDKAKRATPKGAAQISRKAQQ